jgi:hypothetical protein
MLIYRWPERGCCAYLETLVKESQELSKNRQPINVGLLNKPFKMPTCKVIELATNKTTNLIDAKPYNGTGKLTLILFWTKW